MSRSRTAVFLSSGGYHHHLGANTWNSLGAHRRDVPSTGLADVELRAEAARLDAILAITGGADQVTDPSGTSVLFTAKTV